MMKTTSITLGLGHTINRGNFASLRVDASRTAELEEGDNPDAARAVLREDLLKDLEILVQAGMDQV